MNLEQVIRNIPDFPQPGIQFKDITTLLLNPEAFRFVIDTWAERYGARKLDAIIGADARGFIFGSALAYKLGLPLVLVRKLGKLPGKTIQEEFELEYGTATFEIHSDALQKGDRVLLVDDLLATGGTMYAMVRLAERLGATVDEIAFVVELPPLKGRERLNGYAVHSLVQFMVE
ncbi:MAG: adenine phosphoribosyltransferase [Candidatus Hydrogenedentales bacterium]